ncbi:amidohydrolase [Candidatus Lokiarchaeum ossiferum]|uniref:amidohydrolase n=1 Tax=Candidatus Lokiarchaeum ossiferum TaxID=2951803 RepID=UPI00352F596A
MKSKILDWIDSHRQTIIAIGQKIWKTPEVGLLETKSSKVLVEALKTADFTVRENLAKMPTAFIASYGIGLPIIAIVGEFDALPNLNQDTTPFKNPINEGTPGHGCGHNLLGAAGVGACLAIKQLIEAGEIQGTIRFYGTPAEEMFNAKGYMIKEGLFDDVDVALTWHPADINSVTYITSNAMNSVIFKFKGITAHAAGDPYNGRSALDAVELMNVGCNYLREHMISEAKIHYCILKGGDAPNIVPANAEVWYFVRSPKRHQVDELYERVIKVAKGAAMMTETELEIDVLSGTFNTRYTPSVQEIIDQNLTFVGPPKFDVEDVQFALELQKTFPKGSAEGHLKYIPNNQLEQMKNLIKKPLCDEIIYNFGKGSVMGGSTDVGDLCWKMPTAEFMASCMPIGTPGHSWQITASSGMSIGHKGMILAAKVLALSALDFMTNSDLVHKAKEDFKQWTENRPYKAPFPEDLIPPFRQYN